MEESDFQKQYKQQLLAEEKEQLEANAVLIQSFIKHCAESGIVLTPSNFNFFRTTGIFATYPDLVQTLFPSLEKDKEGLYGFNLLLQHFERNFFAPGYLYNTNTALMANTYFRRGFHAINNWAPRFIDLFWKLDDPAIERYISLDADRVKIIIDDNGYVELDTWFGAKFNRDISKIPDGSVKVRPPADIEESIISFFFSNAYSLDINWETKKGIRSFEAEEFKTSDVTVVRNEVHYHPVRYIHAEYDIDSGYFRHFDGAIHFYTPEEYEERKDSDLNHNWKSLHHIKTESEKMFKMNGCISIDTWIEFTSHFFTGKPLIFEYFEGGYPRHILEVLEKVRARK